jgi:hypothetical protein
MSDPVEVWLLDTKSDEHALVTLRRGHSIAIEHLALGQSLDDLLAERDELERAASGAAAAWPDKRLREFGKRLFAYLMHGELLEVFRSSPAADQSPLSIYMLSTHPKLGRVPWEFMRDPKNPADGPNRLRCVVRVTATRCVPPEPLDLGRRRLRILFAAASPIDQGQVNAFGALAAIKAAYTDQLGDKVDMTIVDATTPKNLNKALSHDTFDVFHFSGHGSIDDSGTPGLVLLEGTGKAAKSHFVPASVLATQLQGCGIRLAVLGACNTSKYTGASDFAETATILLGSGIPAVIANQMPITDITLPFFFEPFYRAVLKGETIDAAVMHGRIALYSECRSVPQQAPLEWGIPTLHRLHGAERLVLT